MLRPRLSALFLGVVLLGAPPVSLAQQMREVNSIGVQPGSMTRGAQDLGPLRPEKGKAPGLSKPSTLVSPKGGGLVAPGFKEGAGTVFVMKNRSWYENRREGELRQSVGFKELPAAAKTPAWGSAMENDACAARLDQLAALGLVSSAYESWDATAKAAERQFAAACLDVPTRHETYSAVANRVGRLHSTDKQVRCTVTLIAPRHVLTARHCLFSIVDLSGGQGTHHVAVLNKNALKWSVRFGAFGTGPTYKLKKALLPSEASGAQWSPVDLAQNGFAAVPLSRVALARDYLIIELDRPADVGGRIPMASEPVQQGTKIHLLAFYQGFSLLEEAGDSGIRFQKAGLCQVVLRGSGQCIAHACATNQGASGAPMFVQGASTLTLVGIHIAGNEESSNCGVPGEFQDTLNHGLQVLATDIPQLQ